MMAIPIMVPTVPKFEHYKKYLDQIDENRIYSNFGPLNDLLIFRLSEYLGVNPDNICTVSNATLALQGLIATSSCFEDFDSWSLPSWTFTATAAALGQVQRLGTFVDIDDNWRAVFPDIEPAIIDVAPFGDSIDIERLGKRKAAIIDCAPSFDALRNVKLVASYPVAIVISLHATKLIPAGEGGVVVSNSPNWIQEIKKWSNFGFSKERNSDFLGTNAKLSEFSAAIALASLDSWESNRKTFLDLRQKTLEISHIFNLKCSPAEEKGFATPYWVLRTNSKTQSDRIMEKLSQHSIQTRKWWGEGCHKMPAYANFLRSKLSKTELAAETSLGLPFHLHLQERDFVLIVEALEQALK